MEVLRLIKSGFVEAPKKWKLLISVYIALFGLTLFFFLIGENGTYFIAVIVLVAFTAGICDYIKEYPIRRTRKAFNIIFDKIDLADREEILPSFLYDQTISEYAKICAFQTFIPLNIWENKKEELEMCLNAKIIGIAYHKLNKQIVELTFQIKELPNLINWSDSYLSQYKNNLAIGMSYKGIVELNLEKHPHTFIAGETGSGKSNIMKCLIHQALVKNYDVILIDFKRGVSFSGFSNALDIYFEHEKALNVLKELVKETLHRLDLFRMNKVDNLKDYNKIGGSYLKRKIIFIDELAELLKIRDKEISNLLYDCVETLTRISRSAGINLIMGIQRPDSTIVNGQIKNNVSFRVCGRFVDKEPSRIMLGTDIASRLPNIKGRFIVRGDVTTEMQAFYYDDRIIYQYRPKSDSETLQEELVPKPKIEEKKKEPPVTKQKASKNTTDLNEFQFDFTDIQKK